MKERIGEKVTLRLDGQLKTFDIQDYKEDKDWVLLRRHMQENGPIDQWMEADVVRNNEIRLERLGDPEE